jgi:hypothetical protein
MTAPNERDWAMAQSYPLYDTATLAAEFAQVREEGRREEEQLHVQTTMLADLPEAIGKAKEEGRREERERIMAILEEGAFCMTAYTDARIRQGTPALKRGDD